MEKQTELPFYTVNLNSHPIDQTNNIETAKSLHDIFMIFTTDECKDIIARKSTRLYFNLKNIREWLEIDNTNMDLVYKNTTEWVD